MGTDRGNELRERLMQYALRIFRLSASLANSPEARLVRGQLFRSGTSASAQYREACRARSQAEFVSKMESAQQELDETAFWLEFLERSKLMTASRLSKLRAETEELIRIFAASARTAKKRK
ncbi:MAG TPA: four helix bundle protein [Humisphaera sp.]|jgi:four helix bundle protein|nr:four helix bundle protein [Humisphaera sp.]